MTEKGQTIGRTKVGTWFWDCWEDAHRWLSGVVDPKEYALVINGDCIEGNHHATDEIWSVNPRDHAKAAKEALIPVASRAAKTYMVLGTKCHVGLSEISIAEALRAEVNPEFKQPYWYRLAMNACGVRVSIRHHFPATVRTYLEASQHSIQMGNATNAAVRRGEVPPQVLVGAHRHCTGHFCDGNRLTVVTGAWEGNTDYVNNIAPDAAPCPSIYVLDWRDKRDGELPAVHFRRYNPPVDVAVTL